MTQRWARARSRSGWSTCCARTCRTTTSRGCGGRSGPRPAPASRPWTRGAWSPCCPSTRRRPKCSPDPYGCVRHGWGRGQGLHAAGAHSVAGDRNKQNAPLQRQFQRIVLPILIKRYSFEDGFFSSGARRNDRPVLISTEVRRRHGKTSACVRRALMWMTWYRSGCRRHRSTLTCLCKTRSPAARPGTRSACCRPSATRAAGPCSRATTLRTWWTTGPCCGSTTSRPARGSAARAASRTSRPSSTRSSHATPTFSSTSWSVSLGGGTVKGWEPELFWGPGRVCGAVTGWAGGLAGARVSWAANGSRGRRMGGRNTGRGPGHLGARACQQLCRL